VAEVGPRTSLNGLGAKCPAEFKGHCLRGSGLRTFLGWGTAPGVVVSYEKTVFVWFGDIHGPKPYEFTGFGDIHGTKPYEFIGFGDVHTSVDNVDSDLGMFYKGAI
jgi:hypothetical protein